MKRLIGVVLVGGLSVATVLFAQLVVPQGGTGTKTIGGNDSTNSHLCKSADGTSVVTCVPPTAIPTSTPTHTPTVTPTSTPTSTTPTNTPTITPTNTPTPTRTPTPVVAHGGWFGSAVTNLWYAGAQSALSYMTVPNDTSLEATSGVSVSVWARFHTFVGSASYGIFTKATAAGGTGAAACGDYTVQITSTTVGFGVNGSGSCSWGSIASYAFVPAGAIVPLNDWIHIVGTYSKTQGAAKIYINGVLQATGGAFSSDLNHTGTIGVLGAWYDKTASARQCRCDFDDLRIYKDAALSAGDVQTLYQGGRGEFALNVLSANETLVWRFDEGNGQTATDSVLGLVLTAYSGTSFQAVEWREGIIPTQ